MTFKEAYTLLSEVTDLPPPPIVRFDTTPHESPKHYVANNKAFNISSTTPIDPTMQEYVQHFVKYENKKSTPYKDSRGFLTVGIGHKFEKGEKVKSSYSEKEIMDMFKTDLHRSIDQTKKMFPNFNSLPKEVKIKLVSLTFNMGAGGVSKFNNFRQAILKKDWNTAANELKDSLWFKQVGRRGRDYVNFFAQLG
jgi:lysozyme